MLYRGDREAGRGTELKHTHFTTPPPPSTPFSFTQRYLTPSLSPLKNPLFFFLQKTCREERRRREEEKKRVGGDKGEREEAEKVGSGTRGRGERGRPDGRKEGKKGSLQGLKCVIKGFCTNKQIYESKLIIFKKWNYRRVTALRGRGQDTAAAVRTETTRVLSLVWILLMFFKLSGRLANF